MAGTFKRLIGATHEAVAYGPRIEALSQIIARHLRETDHVLDVGCGNGRLAAACMKTVPGVHFHGLERSPRGGEPISVSPLEGDRFPFEDKAFDVVLLADVVHHEPNPEGLLKECRRVTRRWVLLKDHWHKNGLQYLRICALDLAANYAAGVRCLYRYGTPDSWRGLVDAAGLVMLSTESPLKLYRQPFEALFGGSLHFFAVMAPKSPKILQPTGCEIFGLVPPPAGGGAERREGVARAHGADNPVGTEISVSSRSSWLALRVTRAKRRRRSATPGVRRSGWPIACGDWCGGLVGRPNAYAFGYDERSATGALPED